MATGARTNASDDKPMDEEHRNVLKSCKMELVKDMEPVQVLRAMSSSLLFSSADESEIKAARNREDKCEILLDKLERKGARAYETFKKAIERVHPHLSSIILTEGK